jgi:RND family efflux transporter MFP subunit
MSTPAPNVSFVAQGWSGVTSTSSALLPAGLETSDLKDRLHRAEHEAQFSSAVLELVDKITSTPDLQHSAAALVGELQEYFACQRVSIGLRRAGDCNCRLLAISGLARFDARSEFVRAMESAMDECTLRGVVTAWPVASEAARHGTLAHQRLASLANAEKVLTVPLRGTTGAIIGAIVFAGTANLDRPAGFQAFVRICEGQLGKWIELIQRAQPGSLLRQWQRARRCVKRWQGRVALAAAAMALATLAIPVHYKIKCDCQVQPFTRRFVVAPFEGRLEKALVRQGEVVNQGQLLAQLDGRELRWELAGLTAERSRAGKQRDTAMAAQKAADAQAAKLEMDRLDLKIQLLEHRVNNLEVRSPIDGIIISGDLERAEGAPLTVGQTLFEVAPLDTMVVELAVPEEDISHIGVGQRVAIRLDAYPGQKWHASLQKIHPRAEVRNSQNTFVAELSLNNPQSVLRPGMNGSAKVVGPRKTLGWSLFHKPVDWLTGKLGW